jgi:hypothetical protein
LWRTIQRTFPLSPASIRKNKVEEDHVTGTQDSKHRGIDNDASHDPSGKVSKKGTLSIFYCKDTDKNHS